MLRFVLLSRTQKARSTCECFLSNCLVLLLIFLLSLSLSSSLSSSFCCFAYERKPCPRSIANQFSFPNCFVPDMNPSLPISQASFVMSHNAATGYLPKTTATATSAANLYAKNQLGTAYDQLNSGARALDVRPKLLQNGTVICHHGIINIPVTLETLVKDAIKWCRDNPSELVLIDHLEFAYDTRTRKNSTTGDDDDVVDYSYSNVITKSAETTVNVLSNIYSRLGVRYVECSDLYGLTVRETMELAYLDGGGYLLAMDHHDVSASSCAKGNWISSQLVTCYPAKSRNDDDNITSTSNNFPCTKANASPQMQKLQSYILASANNEPTDSKYELGPPLSLDYYPFYKIQAFWQVDAHSATVGVAQHLSSIIDDNTKSQINAYLVDWVYQMDPPLFQNNISFFMVDQVQLNGNALLSVLRTKCGQSVAVVDDPGKSKNDNDDGYHYFGCRNNPDNDDYEYIPKPRVHYKPMSTVTFFATISLYVAFWAWIAIMIRRYRKYYNHDQEILKMKQELLQELSYCAASVPCTADTTFSTAEQRSTLSAAIPVRAGEIT